VCPRKPNHAINNKANCPKLSSENHILHLRTGDCPVHQNLEIFRFSLKKGLLKIGCSAGRAKLLIEDMDTVSSQMSKSFFHYSPSMYQIRYRTINH
jgi:hypothetical protein